MDINNITKNKTMYKRVIKILHARFDSKAMIKEDTRFV